MTNLLKKTNSKAFAGVLLASFTLFACDKEVTKTPDTGGNTNGETTSVFLKFNTGKAKSRSIEGSTFDEAAELKSALIYFMDDSPNPKVYAIKTVGDVGADVTLEEISKGTEFPKIPSSVKQVYVVGNYNTCKGSGDAPAFPMTEGTLFSAIKNVELAIEQVNYNQIKGEAGSDATLLTLMDGSSPVIPYADSNWPSDVNGPTDEDFVAQVELEPLSARVEIAELVYEGNLKSFEVEGFYVNQFHEKMKMDMSFVGNMLNHGSDVDKYDTSHQSFGYKELSTMYDSYTPSPIAVTPTQEEASVNPGTDKVWAYQVFGGSNEAVSLPHIVIKLTNVIDVNNENLGDRYLTIKGYFDSNSNAIKSLKRGSLYLIEKVEFDNSHLQILPETEAINIWVQVTVKKWASEIVTPEL